MGTIIHRTFIPKQELHEGLDLGAYTVGWHDGWHWTPELNRKEGLLPNFTANTPTTGLGNTGFHTEESFWGLFDVVLKEMDDLPEDHPEADTFGFARLMDDGLHIYEFGVQ